MSADRTFKWDSGVPGFGRQIMANGHESFVFQYRSGTTSRRMKLDGGWFRYEAAKIGKPAPEITGTAKAVAKREAMAVRGAVAQGRDPLAEMRKAAQAEANTLRAVAESYLAQDGSRLRSKGERRRIFERYVYPKLGGRQVDAVRRSEVAKLLARVAVNSGPVQADQVPVGRSMTCGERRER